MFVYHLLILLIPFIELMLFIVLLSFQESYSSQCLCMECETNSKQSRNLLYPKKSIGILRKFCRHQIWSVRALYVSFDLFLHTICFLQLLQDMYIYLKRPTILITLILPGDCINKLCDAATLRYEQLIRDSIDEVFCPWVKKGVDVKSKLRG